MIPQKMLKRILLTFIAIFVFSNSFAQNNESNLNLVILLDASASMKKNDPKGIRKLAAQAIISLLSEKDKVAVLEFDTDARILSEWKNASEHDALFDAINKAGENGAFTDFRAGLEKALEIFRDKNGNSRNIILLLSDGVFEPNPYDSKYAPYHLKYRLAIAGKNREEKKEITGRFMEKITPVAMRMIETEILPAFKEKRIEIFSIAFSPNSDREFMRHLSKSTNLSNETHAFYANDATDLMKSFLSLLHYWENIITLYSEKGKISVGEGKNIFLDQYIEQPLAVLLTQQKVRFSLQGEGGLKENRINGTHPNLQLFPIKKAIPPVSIKYTFLNGNGNYRFLVIGKSALSLTVTHLKEKYVFGEPINCVVKLEYRGEEARPLVSEESYVAAEFISPGGKKETTILENKSEGYLLNFLPGESGDFRLKFTAFVKDKQGKELLPRPGKEYAVKVLPRLYVEPEQVNFGDVGKGKSVKSCITVHSGLSQEVTIKITDRVKIASRCIDEKDRLPHIQELEFVIKPGEVIQKELILKIPSNGCWGDFTGDIYFHRVGNTAYKISYSVHVPSIWEKLTIPIILIFILILLIFLYFVLMWGRLGTPVGVIRILQRPPGDLTSDISLGKIRKGFLKKIINWKKHVVTIGSTGADIKLPQLSMGILVELRFYRFGVPYISNSSDLDSGYIIKIKDPVFKDIMIERIPGKKYYLKHNTEITIEGYLLRYERI